MYHFNTRNMLHLMNTKELTAEASDLGIPPGRDFAMQLYPDACDVGVVVVSERTGEETKWYLDEAVERDQEVVYWLFKPTSESVRAHPGLSGYSLVIFND